MSDEGRPTRADLLSEEAVRLRVELSDLRRRLIAEQEERARLALELHRQGRRPVGSGNEGADGSDRSGDPQDLLARVREAATSLEMAGAELVRGGEASAAAYQAEVETSTRLTAELAGRTETVRELISSTSWRITAPLRAMRGGGAPLVISPELGADTAPRAQIVAPDEPRFKDEVRALQAALDAAEAALQMERWAAAQALEEALLEHYVATSDLHRAADLNDRLLGQLQAERDRTKPG